MKCANCGTENADVRNYCAHCGELLIPENRRRRLLRLVAAEVLLAASLPVGACGAYNLYGAATMSEYDRHLLPIWLIIAIPSLLLGVYGAYFAYKVLKRPRP